jgi:hypothetical protein
MVIARLASAAHGVVSRAELLAEGVTPAEIKWRLRTGALIRVHPGVYRVGHAALSVEATYLAAVKACGPGAFLSGRAAAYLLRLIKGPPPPPEVTAPTKRRVEGVRTRRRRHSATTTFSGISITNVPQTLVDIAAGLAPADLARACHEAGVKYGTTPRHVEAILACHPAVPGAGKLRSVLLGDTRLTLSDLEDRFLAILEEADLPLPITNRVASGRYVDCRWPEHRLTVELDSYTYHGSRHAWERDHRRERKARARGDDFRRFTRDDVFKRPGATVAELSREISVRRR